MAIALSGLIALAVAMGIGRFAFTPILPMMQKEGQLTLAAGGWLASANYVGYFAGALAAMFVRLSPALAIRASLAAIVVTTFAMAFGERMELWLANRALAGMASAWVLVFGSAWALERLTALSRPALGGVVFTGVGAGIALAGIACLAEMQLGASASSAWMVLAAIAAVLTAAVWPIMGRGAVKSAQASSLDIDFRGFAKLTLCYGALGFGYIVPATFLPAMARAQIPDPLAFGWSWPLFGLAAALSTPARRFPIRSCSGGRGRCSARPPQSRRSPPRRSLAAPAIGASGSSPISRWPPASRFRSPARDSPRSSPRRSSWAGPSW
jgi:MFS family permease